MHRFLAAAIIAAMLLVPSAAAAEEAKAGAITVKDAWSRATPEGADVAAGYLTITNSGDAPDRLVSAATAFAGEAEIHQMTMADGMMRMRPVTDGVTIPAKGSVVFAPDGFHLMFTRLKGPLREGEAVKASLTFEHAGKLEITFHVKAMGASSP